MIDGNDGGELLDDNYEGKNKKAQQWICVIKHRLLTYLSFIKCLDSQTKEKIAMDQFKNCAMKYSLNGWNIPII